MLYLLFKWNNLFNKRVELLDPLGSLPIGDILCYLSVCLSVCPFQFQNLYPLSKVEPKWTQVNPSEPKWAQVNPSEPNWTKVNPIEPKWTQVNPSERQQQRQQQQQQ